MQQDKDISLQTLKDIHGIMERSTRFLSLSGWSGVWAGVVALISAGIARMWLNELPVYYGRLYEKTETFAQADTGYQDTVGRFVLLALITLVVAVAGAYFFTNKKARKNGETLWSHSSKKMLIEFSIPLLAGGIFAFAFLWRGHEMYIPAICLAFYGLGLINVSKYTLSDIKYLGIMEIVLGCLCLFLQGYSLLLWSLGFGVLHILYGMIMWKKYDKQQ